MRHQLLPRLLTALFLFVSLSFTLAPIQTSGILLHYADFGSKYVDARNVDVWIPSDYTADKKYAVLYMHDGQLLFDSTATWNHQEWQVDETMTRLMAENKIRNCIVVGIWNNGKKRRGEYMPQKPFNTLKQDLQDSLLAKDYAGAVLSDNYLKFIVEELKPFIDSSFSTLTDRQNTFIAGSSMGALISLYAVCEYPEVFGGAACLSTHWPGNLTYLHSEIPQAINTYLQNNLPDPANHKLYFDYGTVTLDSLYAPSQAIVDITVKQKGFTEQNWITKEFAGENHSEQAWSKRLYIPLEFLLKP